MRSYLIKHSIVATCLALLFFLLSARVEELQTIQRPLWLSFVFLNVLFLFIFSLFQRSMKMESQYYFMTFFGVSVAIKFFAALLWMLYWGLVEGLKTNAFILSFFAMYFAFLFTLMIEVWFSTKRNTTSSTQK